MFLNFFFDLIKTKSKTNTVKISKFGTFSYKKSKERTGRNPKTLEEFIIPSKNKLNFKVSSKAKTITN